MSQTINELIQRLSCELVLAEPSNPETFSRMLPILNQAHSQCAAFSLSSQADQILEARQLIDNMADPLKKNGIGDLQTLEGIFTRLSIESQAGDLVGEKQGDKFDLLTHALEEFQLMIGGYRPGMISDRDGLLAISGELINRSKEIEPDTFFQISRACQSYLERMIQEESDNTKPVEEGLVLLKSLLSHLKKGEPFTFDYSDVLELLRSNLMADHHFKERASEELPLEEGPSQGELERISDDDMEILRDFVSEAEENLDSIEVNLIELEQDPGNTDIINEIFRPFHTIKGVSGFLSLTKINLLAHATENLLDSARSGEFSMNQIATDAVLEAVDTLKLLVGGVKEGVGCGVKQPDDHIAIDALRDKLGKIQVALASGEKEPLGEILVRQNAIKPIDLDQALDEQKAFPDKKIGEILVEQEKVEPKAIASALMAQAPPAKKIATQVKVSTQKLDDLVDYAGELVIAQSMLKQKTINDAGLNQTVIQLGQIVSNMQNIAMSMRMIPIKATFMKMIRLVRDLSRKSGKDIQLSMIGEDTEIDRNVVDALYEPMVHMIRNSCDHGIESAEKRIGAGKPSQGTVSLRAFHKGGNIVIEIQDDGKGLDKDAILKKAVSTGLITGREQMTDAQIYNLIMEPGFSTAKKITDVSGRGVGMDVVKQGIEKFRGQLTIESEKGEGSKFTISLPLTLAIIDGMLVRVGDEKYVIPTMAIQRAFKPGEDQYFTVEGKGEMVTDRGSLIPLIRLSMIYGSGERSESVHDGLVVVVESKEEKRALLIDDLLGKDEYVIKSLGKSLEAVEGIAGGAILGNGKVGLILDIHGIFSIVSNA